MRRRAPIPLPALLAAALACALAPPAPAQTITVEISAGHAPRSVQRPALNASPFRWNSPNQPIEAPAPPYLDPRLFAPPDMLAPPEPEAPTPEPRPLRARGLERLIAGDAPGAARLLERVVADDPDDTDARRHLALALLATGRRAQGAGTLAEVLTLDPALIARPSALAAEHPLLRRIERDVTALATTRRDAPAWLAAAAVAQYRQRPDLALDYLARAHAAGLPDADARALRLALDAHAPEPAP